MWHHQPGILHYYGGEPEAGFHQSWRRYKPASRKDIIVNMSTTAIGTGRRTQSCVLFNNIISFVRDSNFDGIDQIVIETQMTALMKAIARVFLELFRCSIQRKVTFRVHQPSCLR